MEKALWQRSRPYGQPRMAGRTASSRRPCSLMAPSWAVRRADAAAPLKRS